MSEITEFPPVDLPKCPKCGEPQWSLMDRKYLEISHLRPVHQCWGCDKRDWEAGALSLSDFEARENMALENT